MTSMNVVEPAMCSCSFSHWQVGGKPEEPLGVEKRTLPNGCGRRVNVHFPSAENIRVVLDKPLYPLTILTLCAPSSQLEQRRIREFAEAEALRGIHGSWREYWSKLNFPSWSSSA